MPSGMTTVPTTLLGARIRELREAQGWSQLYLGLLIDYGQHGAGRISDYETGKREPSLALLVRIARAFQLSVSELLEGVL